MGNGALAIGPKLPRPFSTLPKPTSYLVESCSDQNQTYMRERLSDERSAN
jgi:hypothetical protein